IGEHTGSSRCIRYETDDAQSWEMNLNMFLITPSVSLIVFLLSTRTEDQYERTQDEIRSLSKQHGAET
ncbi:hypothetical protein BS47DRAFT_1346407, partial [Hydnum rufescens UP504]